MDVPTPAASGPYLLVETRATVVSAGTERMLVEFGRSNLIEKARQQPDKVRQVLDKVRTDGIGPTLEAVRSKLDTPIALGYCQAGVVVEAGSDVRDFAVGDRVVTNGSHAEFARVPHTLAAKIPHGVSFEAAAFAPIAAIGLQGIRLAEPTLGETFVVVGLGLIGLLTVQMLKANGCRVIGIDPDPNRCELARSFGVHAIQASDTAPAQVLELTNGFGADGVLLTLASASDEPMRQAATMSRKRGRIILVGVTGLNLARDDFYRKELRFAVSCSYGPGRYDPAYEEAGQDYPFAFVRWTEQRNFQAVLDLMASGQLDPLPLITHRFNFETAPTAYDVISGSEPSLGVVLTYPEDPVSTIAKRARTVTLRPPEVAPGAANGSVAVIGAGNFAMRTLLPILRKKGVRFKTIASGAGTSSAVAAEKFAFEQATTDIDAVLSDKEIDSVFLLTRHDSHARLTIRALEAGKHVFVEKPLALTEEELDAVEQAVHRSGRLLMVGFNRRFAPLTRELRTHLSNRAGPLSIIASVNAGMIPRDHWTQDPKKGGGRIMGEACHWIDLCRSLVGVPITGVHAVSARDSSGRPIDDIAHISLTFEDGSTGVVHYLANGSRAFPKERIEVFFDGKTVSIDNWRRLLRFGLPRPLLQRPKHMDKGHAAEIDAWLAGVEKGEFPIPLSELFEVTRYAIIAGLQARS